MFCVKMTCTRNGSDYGASQYPFYYRTLCEVQDAIAKRVKSTVKSYAKKFVIA
jgi:hypothetical protein